MRNRPLAARSLNVGINKEQSLPTIMPNIISPDSRAPSQIENNNPNLRLVSNLKKVNNLFANEDHGSKMSHTLKKPVID